MQGFKPGLRTLLTGVLLLVVAAYAGVNWPALEAKVAAFYVLPFLLAGFLFMLAKDVGMFSFARHRGSVESWDAYRVGDGVALIVGMALIGAVILMTPTPGYGPKPFWYDLGINPFFLIVVPLGLVLTGFGWLMRHRGHLGRSILMSGLALLVGAFVSVGIELANPMPQLQAKQATPAIEAEAFVCQRVEMDEMVRMVCKNAQGEQAPHVSTRIITR